MHSQLSHWLERIQENHPDSIELGLARCAAVWERMGQPRPAPQVITVAGTNGKGTTVAGIEAAFLHLGQRTGCYTSPHLLRFEERVRINGRHADTECIIRGFERVEAARNDTRLTYFEFVTLAAISSLEQSDLEVAVLEVGLGGRLDAVNIIDADVAVITTIGIDHQEYLGNDRESIGSEKAGIMRAGQSVVCSDREPPQSVHESARKSGAGLITIGEDFEVSRQGIGSDSETWRYFYGDRAVEFPVSVHAPHLADNLAGALTAAIQLEPQLTGRLAETARAVASSRVPGRLERLATHPDIIVDVGHNPLAAAAIGTFLQRRGSSGCLAVLAMLEDKDAGEVARLLNPHVARWFCAGLALPRGQTADSLAKRVIAVNGAASVVACATVADALDAARRQAGPTDTILVLGSFFTVAEAMKHLDTDNQ